MLWKAGAGAARPALAPGKYPQTSPQAAAKTVEMWTICCAQNARFSQRQALSGPGRRVRLFLHRARSASRSKQLPRAVGGSRRFTGDVDESATGSVNFFWSFTGVSEALTPEHNSRPAITVAGSCQNHERHAPPRLLPRHHVLPVGARARRLHLARRNGRRDVAGDGSRPRRGGGVRDLPLRTTLRRGRSAPTLVRVAQRVEQEISEVAAEHLLESRAWRHGNRARLVLGRHWLGS
jgi:hypothetical protein